MGCYVNPKEVTKEAWLANNGKELPYVMDGDWGDFYEEDSLPVCLIDNGIFTAAGIAYSEREFEAFRRPDGRPRRWYIVPIAKLREVSEVDLYLK